MPPTEWPPKFQPHDRVIDLLVGPQLYTSADTAVRELLQNAEDACNLQLSKDGTYQPKIVVAYSSTDNWCSFRDNGLGMNKEAIQRSYAWIGAPKTEVQHIKDLINAMPAGQRQIAQFGIGVLSCFGVAKKVELRTAMDGDDPIALEVDDYHEPFKELSPGPFERGTEVRLILKPDGAMKASNVPAAVQKYARHAGHVMLLDADTGSQTPVIESWIPLPATTPTTDIGPDTVIRSGRLALDQAWFSMGTTFGAELLTCNGGFFVSSSNLELLPTGATGYAGEIDLVPGALNILMNREGFARDDLWNALGMRMRDHYAGMIERAVETYEQQIGKGPVTDATERGLVLLSRGPLRSILPAALVERIDKLAIRGITIGLRDSTIRLSVTGLLDRVGDNGTIYFVREDEKPQNRSHSYADGESNSSIQVTEAVTTGALRALQLQGKGHTVVTLRQRAVPFRTAGGDASVNVHELDIVSGAAGHRGIKIMSVSDAAPEDVALDPLPESSVINDVLDIGDGFRLVNLPGSSQRIIPDYSGRLLNVAHPDIVALIRAIPASIGNPVLRTVIKAYVDLGHFDMTGARDKLKDLLQDPELADKAQLSTSPYLKEYLEEKLARLAGGRNE